MLTAHYKEQNGMPHPSLPDLKVENKEKGSNLHKVFIQIITKKHYGSQA